MESPTGTIFLAGKNYRAKIVDNTATVEVDGRWISADQFIDDLIQAEDTKAIQDVIEIGMACRAGMKNPNAYAKHLHGSHNN